MDVGCQVFEGGLTGADSLDMDDPMLFPNTFGNLVMQTGFLATIPELGANEDGQWFAQTRDPNSSIRVFTLLEKYAQKFTLE
jgi:hypothetical protein